MVQPVLSNPLTTLNHSKHLKLVRRIRWLDQLTTCVVYFGLLRGGRDRAEVSRSKRGSFDGFPQQSPGRVRVVQIQLVWESWIFTVVVVIAQVGIVIVGGFVAEQWFRWTVVSCCKLVENMLKKCCVRSFKLP